MFRGLITVTTGSNDDISFYEEDGDGNTDNLTATLTAGDYYPGSDTEAGSLCEEIKTQMEAASALGATGGQTYSVSISNAGIVTISVSGVGSAPAWYPKITTAETSKFFTGGDPGAAGERGSNHFGWNVDAAYPVAASSQVGDVAISNSWHPAQPISGGSSPRNRSIVTFSESGGGDVRTYDFTGNPEDSSGNSYLDRWDVRWSRISEANRAWFFSEFWRPYAKQGLPDSRFRFYPDRDDLSTYHIAGMIGDILREAAFERTITGYPLWTISFEIKRYKP